MFEAIVFDAPPLNMCSGSIYVAQLGLEMQGWTHAIEVGDCVLLARLFFQRNGLKVDVRWLHPEEKDGEYPYKSLSILGAVVELYPTGDLSVRVVQYRDGLIYQPSYDLPYLVPGFSR